MRGNTTARWLFLLAICSLGSSDGWCASNPGPSSEAASTAALPKPSEPDSADTRAEAQQPPPFKSAKEKLSYAVGVEWAAGLKWQHMDVDPEWMLRGARDALGDERTALLLSPKELAETLKSYKEDRQRGIAHATAMIGDKNERAGIQFAADNAKKQGVVTLPSGLQYKVLKSGGGSRPTLKDSVEIHYRGTLLDGSEFDSSYGRNEPLTVPVRRMIKGWQEALQMMPAGSKWQLYVPPQLAYGKRGAGSTIGPNATLVFDVELLSVKSTESDDGNLQAASR